MMLLFLLLCVRPFLGFCSCLGFPVSDWFGSPNEPETATSYREPDDTERARDSEAASVSDYDVFLSFRGPDSRQRLADVLYRDMTTAGVRVFRDNDELEAGDRISKILPAIENSKICVPIFSETFAASVWCLLEVEKMVQLKKTIMPIFDTATPDDVKLRTELLKTDLRNHEKKHGREQVKKWEDALKAVGKIIGREVTTGYGEFSTKFVRSILIKLRAKTKYVPEFLVKRDRQEKAVMKLLDIDSSDVRLVGIHGMHGTGKTTLAKVVFNQLSARFDYCSFVENVHEFLRSHGVGYLQKQLVEDFDPRLKYFHTIDYVNILKDYFRRRVLLVLDDVKEMKQIKNIFDKLDCFGSGSRIIVTSTDRRVFPREVWAFEMHEMDQDQALQLFSRHAFGDDSPPTDYRILSEQVLSLTGGLPLALEVIGSRLNQCDKKLWKATIEKLKKIPNPNVHEKLKMSFDVLEYEEKQIFLDIACFFVNKETSSAIYLWEACEFYPEVGIEVLVALSLVKIVGNEFRMHDLIRDLGRELVREECFGDPAKRSRIWSRKEALEVLKIKQGKRKVEGLFLEESVCKKLTNEQFSSFRNLRLLKLVDTSIEGDFEDLFPKIKWFSWHRCPSDFSATNFSLETLVVLDLSQSVIDENWAGWNLIQMAENLKVLDLRNCCNLRSMPDLSSNSSLERLILRGCCGLAEIHSSIGKLKKLKHLDLKGCSSLRGLPEEFGSLEDLEEIRVDGEGNTFYLPESIGNLVSLSTIEINRMEIKRIPDSIGGLLNLTCLTIRHCIVMETLPDAIGDLKSLIELDLCFTKLSALPNSIGRLLKLRTLRLKSTKVEELPDTLGDLKSLVTLSLHRTKVKVLPNTIEGLTKLRNLDLQSTDIEELPDALGDLTSLIHLDLSGTNLTALPKSVGRLHRLQFLHLRSTKVEELPDSIRDLKWLQTLDLRSSRLRSLPDFIGDMTELTKLWLDNCKIRALPASIGNLPELQDLSAGSSEFSTEIPEEVGNICDLRRLHLSGPCRLPATVNQLSLLNQLTITVCEHSSLVNEASCSIFEGIENLPNSVWLRIHCSGLKCIPQLPSTLSELDLSYVTAKTRLPDFSNLKCLQCTSFTRCSLNDKLETLKGLPTLNNITLNSCSKELVEFSFLVPTLRRLTLSRLQSSEKVLDFPRLIHLHSLTLTDCRELAEVRGLQNLEILESLQMERCSSLEVVQSLSESKMLARIRIWSCSKLKEIEGLNRLFLDKITIYRCESIRNIDELKKRCREGHFNGLEVRNQ